MGETIKGLLSNKEISIIASLPENRIDLAQAAIDAGADALKFHINVSHRASGNEFKDVDFYIESFKEIRSKFTGPIGLVIGDNILKVLEVDTQFLKSIGFNYYSLYAKDISSKLLTQNDLEQTVALDDKFSVNNVRVIESFNIQAVELSIINKDDYGKPLSFEDLITYKNFRDNTKLPIIIPSQKKITPCDLLTLKDIGVNAVMLGAVTFGTTEKSIYKTISQFKKKKSNC